MSKNPPVFRSISAPLEVPDEALNALGDQLGVPKMVKPEPILSPKAASSPENSGVAALSEASRIYPAPAQKDPSPAQKPLLAFTPPETPVEKITVELPAYLTAALRRQGAERRITIRTLVMMGLQALGFEVNQQDLVPDGRRTRPRSGS
jgi:hypothetical protein